MGDKTSNQSCLPFLKWAGGKRWLADELRHQVPVGFRTYIEPFLGSGAFFFTLRPSKAILSDLNRDLIQTYRAIKEDWRSVENALRKHHTRHSQQHYYKTRSSKPRTAATHAARLIYLNRTCWNGLYRVNRQGWFNVPIGTKKLVCLPTDNFCQIHELLRGTKLVRSDFEKIINKAGSRDLVFVDPPYTTLHSNNGFIKYNEKLFSWQDQVRLRDCIARARNRGAFIFATNADHPSIRTLYKSDFHITALRRSSVIASDPRYRQSINELLITSAEVTIK